VKIGYSGDVWNVQPAPKDHVWRTMKNPLGGGNGMVPHYSGTTLDAQARYANGTRSILENYLNGKPQEAQNIIIGLSKFTLCTRRSFTDHPSLEGYETPACKCFSLHLRFLAPPHRFVSRRPASALVRRLSFIAPLVYYQSGKLKCTVSTRGKCEWEFCCKITIQ